MTTPRSDVILNGQEVESLGRFLGRDESVDRFRGNLGVAKRGGQHRKRSLTEIGAHDYEYGDASQPAEPGDTLPVTGLKPCEASAREYRESDHCNHQKTSAGSERPKDWKLPQSLPWIETDCLVNHVGQGQSEDDYESGEPGQTPSWLSEECKNHQKERDETHVAVEIDVLDEEQASAASLWGHRATEFMYVHFRGHLVWHIAVEKCEVKSAECFPDGADGFVKKKRSSLADFSRILGEEHAGGKEFRTAQ